MLRDVGFDSVKFQLEVLDRSNTKRCLNTFTPFNFSVFDYGSAALVSLAEVTTKKGALLFLEFPAFSEDWNFFMRLLEEQHATFSRFYLANLSIIGSRKDKADKIITFDYATLLYVDVWPTCTLQEGREKSGYKAENVKVILQVTNR